MCPLTYFKAIISYSLIILGTSICKYTWINIEIQLIESIYYCLYADFGNDNLLLNNVLGSTFMEQSTSPSELKTYC